MTGRDLIILILQNGLEDEEFFTDDHSMGFMTLQEAASKFGVGTSTVMVWFVNGHIPGCHINNEIHILKSAKHPFKK